MLDEFIESPIRIIIIIIPQFLLFLSDGCNFLITKIFFAFP